MDLIGQILNFIFSKWFIIFLFIFIILYHIILFFIRDKQYINAFRKNINPKVNSIEDLIDTPLVNVIIPAWKEGEIFKLCMQKLAELNYPKLKIIINAGGNEETMKIANSFNKFENFLIIEQKAGGGKIKAINDALKLVERGIVCILDADVSLGFSTLLTMLYKIINEKIDVVVAELKPIKSILGSDLIIYLFINRNPRFRSKFTNYGRIELTQCACLNYNVILNIGEFTEKRLYGDGKAMANDIINKNYKIYQLSEPIAESYNYPNKISKFIRQNIRWVENGFFFNLKKNKIKVIVKFLILIFFSLYIIAFPFLIFINIYLVLIGASILIYFYLKKIREVIFFKKTTDKEYFGKLGVFFYFKILLYIYIEALMNIYIFFELLIFQDKKLKKRKNID
ncbi:MAG: glycosyltransferase [Promethearchaeota archaeon]